ncbi:MAG: amino acid ABC transporter substrate-binding protein [Betaproteobacteria bacterium]
MKRTSILFAGLMASAGLVIAGGASAQELTGTLKKIKDSGSISVGHRDASIPFSYLDDKQQPIGYSMDLCMKIVDAVKANLKMPNLKIVLTPVTSATRIPLLANGTVDMECGSTTNNLDRQKQISYVVTTFVTANRVMAKKSSKVAKLDDLKGKALVSTSGTTNLKQVTELNASRNLGMNIMAAKDHAEAFLMVETDRVTAFAMDDILLYGLVASAKTPGDFMVSNEALSVEPYGIMVRKDDPAFKKVADDAVVALFKSGEINKIYSKWFQSAIPPKNVNLNLPMSDQLKKVIAKPTDSGDPAAY